MPTAPFGRRWMLLTDVSDLFHPRKSFQQPRNSDRENDKRLAARCHWAYYRAILYSFLRSSSMFISTARVRQPVPDCTTGCQTIYTLTHSHGKTVVFQGPIFHFHASESACTTCQSCMQTLRCMVDHGRPEIPSTISRVTARAGTNSHHGGSSQYPTLSGGFIATHVRHEHGPGHPDQGFLLIAPKRADSGCP